MDELVNVVEVEEELVTCECCGRTFREEELTYTTDDEWVCEDCLGNYYVFCEECGDLVREDNVTWIDDAPYCETCRDENFYECEECGNYIRQGEEYWDGDDENIIHCEECHDEYCNNNVILSYHGFGSSNYRPHRTGNENKFTEVLIGAELEIENNGSIGNNEMALRLRDKDMYNIIHFEHDGSLDDGFEIITQPLSVDYWYNMFGYWKDLMSDCRTQGFNSHDTDTCGLHFHVSRDCLPTNTRTEEDVIDNILVIVETFKEELKQFARRGSGEYTRFLTDGDSSVTMKSVKSKKRDGDRYVAVNLTKGKTIEFRMFRGTLIYETFMASVELVKNIVNIAKYRNIEGLTWNDIVLYHRTKNLYITQYCQTRDIKVGDECVHVLEEWELHKKEFTMRNFIDGKFVIRMDYNISGYNLYGILGFLLGKLDNADLTTWCDRTDLIRVLQITVAFKYVLIKDGKYFSATDCIADNILKIKIEDLCNLWLKSPKLARL